MFKIKLLLFISFCTLLILAGLSCFAYAGMDFSNLRGSSPVSDPDEKGVFILNGIEYRPQANKPIESLITPKDVETASLEERVYFVDKIRRLAASMKSRGSPRFEAVNALYNATGLRTERGRPKRLSSNIKSLLARRGFLRKQVRDGKGNAGKHLVNIAQINEKLLDLGVDTTILEGEESGFIPLRIDGLTEDSIGTLDKIIMHEIGNTIMMFNIYVMNRSQRLNTLNREYINKFDDIRVKVNDAKLLHEKKFHLQDFLRTTENYEELMVSIAPKLVKTEMRTGFEMIKLNLNQILVNDSNLYPKKQNLNKLITSIVKVFDYGTVSAEGVAVKTELDNRLNYEPYFVNVDALRFKQVLINMFKNSVIAMKNYGKFTITTKLNKGVIIEVEDTGTGIPREIRHKVFDNEFSTNKTDGVGLYVSKSIIEAHGGEITLASNGNGAKFIITLPLASSPIHETVKEYQGIRGLAIAEFRRDLHSITALGWVMYAQRLELTEDFYFFLMDLERSEKEFIHYLNGFHDDFFEKHKEKIQSFLDHLEENGINGIIVEALEKYKKKFEVSPGNIFYSGSIPVKGEVKGLRRIK